MLAAEILYGRDRLAELKSDWDRIMERGDFEPSASYEWTASLMESHVLERDEIVSVILKRHSAVIGIVPLVLRTTQKFGQTFIMAFPISELSNTHSDLLVQETSAPVLGVFVDTLYRPDLGWDVFSMTRLLEARPLGGLLCELVRRRRSRYECARVQPSFFLTLDSTFDGYLRRRSGSFRNALNRIERKLMSRGRVEIRAQDDFPCIDEAYDTLLSIEHRSWKQAHGTSIAAVSRQTTFYRRLCAVASQKGWLHLRFLYLDGRPVAYNLGLILKETYFYLKTSYDYAERPLSPATLLRAKLLEELIGRGVKQFDFPGEPYEWERQWTDEMRWHQALVLYAPSARGVAYSLYRRVKAIVRGDRSGQLEYVNPRDLKPGLP